MPWKRRNMSRWDGITGPLRNWLVHVVDTPPDYWVSGADLNGASVGSAFTLKRRVPPVHAVNVKVTVTDADNTADVTVTVEGVDQFGVRHTEDIRVQVTAGGVGSTWGTRVWRRIDRIELKSKSGVGAGDTLDVGSPVGNSLRIGFPVRVVKDSTYDSQQEHANAFGTVTVAFCAKNNIVGASSLHVLEDVSAFTWDGIVKGDVINFAFEHPFGD